MKAWNQGIYSSDLPVKLIDNSYGNDICPSYYFRIGDQFYQLWIDYLNKEDRENPESLRFSLHEAENLGDAECPEIYDRSDCVDIFTSEEPEPMVKFIRELCSQLHH
ncbi:hypothetical protein ABMA58_01005 [Oceanospirillum sp. HFRX-1_2]